MSRASWDDYFMKIATVVAERGTCDRKQVGCVIIGESKSILSTGYNGSIKGLPHCDEVGHMMEDGHCIRTIHAEANAIAQAAANGTRLQNSTLYVTASPCWLCFKMLSNAGVKRVVYGEFYRDERIFEAAKAAGIQIEHHPIPNTWTSSV